MLLLTLALLMFRLHCIRQNNRLKHRVEREGPHERVTMIIDVAERPCARTIEVGPKCTGWEDPDCLLDLDVMPAEW